MRHTFAGPLLLMNSGLVHKRFSNLQPQSIDWQAAAPARGWRAGRHSVFGVDNAQGSFQAVALVPAPLLVVL
jgi:hypothetical protein